MSQPVSVPHLTPEDSTGLVTGRAEDRCHRKRPCVSPVGNDRRGLLYHDPKTRHPSEPSTNAHTGPVTGGTAVSHDG